MSINVEWLKCDQHAKELIDAGRWTAEVKAKAENRILSDLHAHGATWLTATGPIVRELATAYGLHCLFSSVKGIREAESVDDVYVREALWYDSEYKSVRERLTYTAITGGV